MKALILKDLLCLRQQAKSVGLVLLVKALSKGGAR